MEIHCIFQMVGFGAVWVSLLMAILWVKQVFTKNAGEVDLGWTIALFIMTMVYFIFANGYLTRKIIILVLVGLWAARLGLYLAGRIAREKKEDARYQKIRAQWQNNVQLKFFLFYQLQALTAVVLSTPFLIISLNASARAAIIEWLGVGIWVLGFIGEFAADDQLRRFKQDPQNKGKTCQVGLWQYSRHPNYFFEWLMWVGYFVLALGSSWGWLAMIAPAFMLYFLLKVSGVPLAEEQSLRSRGEEYREYQRTTSVFVPLPRRK